MMAVALSVMTLFALGMVYGGVMAGVQVNAERIGARIMVVPRDAAAEISDTTLLFTGAPAPIYFPTSTADAITDIGGIGKTTVRFFSQTLDESCCSTDGAMRLIGVDFSTDWTVQPFASVDLSGGLGTAEVIVGADVGGVVGEDMVLLGDRYRIVDRLEASGSDLDDSILLDIEAARSLSGSNRGLSYLWNRYGDPIDLVSCVLVDIDGSVVPNIVLNRIGALDGVTAIERTSVVETAQSQIEAVFVILLGVGVLMLVSTLGQLCARFYACVWERKSELALYRAIGASKGQVRMLIGGEVAVIMVVGLGVGFVAGAALCGVLLDLLRTGAAFPFIGLGPEAIAGLVAALVLILFVLALIAIASPLAQIARLDPSLAMQQGDID